MDAESMHGAVAAMLDQVAIARVAAEWGLFRDTGQWEKLRALYAADGVMHTTWFAGPAAEFIDRSMEAAARGARVRHAVGATAAVTRGDRAIAETGVAIILRAAVAGAPVDVTCHGRFHDRLVRERGAWRIKLRVPIYDRDRLDPVMPGDKVEIDRSALAQFPEGYRFLAYVQSLTGGVVPPGLPTAHSAEEANLCAESALWLAGAASPAA